MAKGKNTNIKGPPKKSCASIAKITAVEPIAICVGNATREQSTTEAETKQPEAASVGTATKAIRYASVLAKRDQEIHELKAAVAEKDKQIIFLGSNIGNRDKTIAQLQNQILAVTAHRDGTLANLQVKNTSVQNDPSSASAKVLKTSGKRKRDIDQDKGDVAATGQEAVAAPSLATEKMKEHADNLEEIWKAKLRELADFRMKHGHCNVPLKYKANLSLGKWVSKQREDYKNYNDTASFYIDRNNSDPKLKERIDQMNELGFWWNERMHKERIAQLNLIEFCWDPTAILPTPDLTPQKNDGKNKSIAREPSSELQSPEYSPPRKKRRKGNEKMTEYKGNLEKKWVVKFQELVDFKAANGHCNVPLKYKVNTPLGRWVSKQREDFRGTGLSKPMPVDRIARLNEIGFCWNTKRDVTSLKPEMSHNSKQDKPSVVEEAAAARASTQEADSKSSPSVEDCKPKRRKDTPKMKEYYANLQEKWNLKFEELVAFKAAYGHCNIPLKFKGNPPLGRWVNKQREDYRGLGLAHPMPQERIDRLNEIGFEWKLKDDTNMASDSLSTRFWNERINELVAYKEEYGDCIVPRNWSESPKLANFVARVRRSYRLQQLQQKDENENGKRSGTTKDKRKVTLSSSPSVKPDSSFRWLTQDRIEQLNNLGFVWALRHASPNELWEEKYQKLKAYNEKFGDCRVTKCYDKALNGWTLNQRQAYKNTMDDQKANDPNRSTLNAERIAKLQLLGFEWDLSKQKNEEAWETRFRELIKYKSEHQHCRVPKQYRPNMKLSNWVYDQRKNYRTLQSGKGGKGLTEERIKRLEELGFEWMVWPAKLKAGVQEDDEVLDGEMGIA